MKLWRSTTRLAGAAIRHGLQRAPNQKGPENVQNTNNPARETESIQDARETSCVVIGGGQAGAMLSLLLSQNDVSVSRLESYEDFQRSVDPDAVHSAVAEVLEQLGFAERNPELAHRELPLTLPTLLVVPAVHEASAEKEPAALENPGENDRTIAGENHGGEEHQFELGRARGRIELLEQEIRRREGEIAGLRKRG